VPGSFDLPEGQPGRVYLLVVNLGLYMGVVLSEGVLITVVDRGMDGGVPVLFASLYALLSMPGLLVLALALCFVPPAWPWRWKRLLALIGSVVVVGGWLLVVSASTSGVSVDWPVWTCVLFGLVVFGLVARIPPPKERNRG